VVARTTYFASHRSAISHASKTLIGQFDRFREVCLSSMSGWSSGPISFLYRPSAPHRSSDQTDLFIEKDDPLCLLSDAAVERSVKGFTLLSADQASTAIFVPLRCVTMVSR
jgi:hypothetical protein